MKTKAEKREEVRRNNRKMIVRGRSIFTITRIKVAKAEKAQKRYGPK